MNEIKGYNIKKFNCQIINIGSLKEKIKELDIKAIDTDCELITPTYKVFFCDEENPVVYVNSNLFPETLVFNSKYFNNLENELEEIIIEVCKNIKSEIISIRNSSLITKSVLEALRDNKNIKRIALGSEKSIFTLNEYWYQEFSKVGKVSIDTESITESLQNNFDSMIKYNRKRHLIKSYNYDTLQSIGAITLDEKLNDEELNNLKYLDKETRVNINYNEKINLLEIVNKLRELKHTGDIFINVNDKNIFNSFAFSNLKELEKLAVNVNVYYKNESFSLVKYLKNEKILMDLIKPAINMSPFEKYLYAYNVVKNYKPYKENNEDKLSARRLYSILDNEYMVCVGYSALLGDLLDKLGIENIDYNVSVDCGLDEVKRDVVVLPEYVLDKQTGNDKPVLSEEGKHARRLIHLIDPKYDIDGYYFSDPTWDNNDKVDSYNYALMTNEEYIGTDRYNYFKTWSFCELLFINDLEEFYNKINILLKKNPKKSEKDVISLLGDFFKKVDREFYLKLVEFNKGITKYSYKFSKEEIQDIFLFIGEHLLEKVNNLVDGHTFKDGITEIYRTYYVVSGVELEEKVNEVMSENKRCYDYNFPMRYKIDKSDNSLVILNSYNKFDLDSEPKLGI